MSHSHASVAATGHRGPSARQSLTLALLVCSVLTFGCASRRQVEKLEERLVSMDDTLQQMAAGQDVARADTAARLDLIEDYLAADGKDKTRLLQEIKSQRMVRNASTKAAAQWSPPAAPDLAQKIVPEQQVPAPAIPPAPALAPVTAPTVPPAATATTAPVSPAVPVAPAAVATPSAATTAAASTVASAPIAAAPPPADAAAPTEPEVIKRGVSKPTAGYAGQGGALDATAPASGAPLDLDPNRLVSKPIYQSGTPAPATEKPAAAPKAVASNPTDSYEEAVKLIQAGKVDRGRQLLNAYIQENPKGAMLPNAYYWLGETFYHDKRYAQAILTFKDVTARFPKHDKAAAALLKIGFAYEQLGDKPNARFYLGTLVKEYPRSGAAATAKEALQGRLK